MRSLPSFQIRTGFKFYEIGLYNDNKSDTYYENSYVNPILAADMLFRCFVFICVGLGAIACSSSKDAASADYARPRSKSASTEAHRTEVVDFATSLVGSKYRYGGISPKSGFDCSGFTLYVAGRYGYALPRTSGDQAGRGKVLDPRDARPGDLLFFGKGRQIEHVGMVVRRSGKSLEMVHCSSSKGVLVEDVFRSEYWSKRLLFAADLESYQ